MVALHNHRLCGGFTVVEWKLNEPWNVNGAVWMHRIGESF